MRSIALPLMLSACVITLVGPSFARASRTVGSLSCVVSGTSWSTAGMVEDLEKDLLREFQGYAKKVAAEYEIQRAASREGKLILRPEPVLNWTNPVEGKVYGSTFIWTLNVRPEAIGDVHRWHINAGVGEEHTFHSLSLSTIVVQRRGQLVWHPAKPGVELKPVPGAPKPADSTTTRLQQMKSLARQFEAFMYPDRNRFALRLLTQPIYRYESTDPDLLDGGLFTFVRSTDPAVLLLVESRRTDEGHEWQYGLARMNALALDVVRDNRIVSDFPNRWDRVRWDRKDPFTAFLEREDR